MFIAKFKDIYLLKKNRNLIRLTDILQYRIRRIAYIADFMSKKHQSSSIKPYFAVSPLESHSSVISKSFFNVSFLMAFIQLLLLCHILRHHPFQSASIACFSLVS